MTPTNDDPRQTDIGDYVPPETMDKAQCLAEIDRCIRLSGIVGGPSEAVLAQRVYALTRRLRRLQIGLLGAAPTAEQIYTRDRRKPSNSYSS